MTTWVHWTNIVANDLQHQFRVGQRVIVKHSLDPWLNGYYGHVVTVRSDLKPCFPSVDVLFQGRVGGSFDLAEVGDAPYPTYPRELEHAD